MSTSSRSKIATRLPSARVPPARPPSARAVPTRAPSARATGSKSQVSIATQPQAPKKKAFTIPALSVPPKIPALDPVLEKLKRKTVRRNTPQGEDIKKIRELIKGLNNQAATVQEYVGLISPYTGDNGNVLRTVMGEDLATFRKMAKRVYDTMTQDVSDVLANEQINLTEHYNERYTLLIDKMMRTTDEIYEYIPNFNFERYYKNPEQYLKKAFPLISADMELDPEEEEMQRRQEAYHRLQWLRSEGIRLNEENRKLQARLRQLKRDQQQELENVRQREEMAEAQKTHLENAQADLQNQLQDLHESMDKSLLTTEQEIRITDDSNMVKERKPRKKASAKSQPKPKREPWNVQTAKKLETESLEEASKSAVSSVSVISTSSKGGVKKKTKTKVRKKIEKRDTSPFHYSPVKTPPQQQRTQREASPFHYSPPKTPIEYRAPAPAEPAPQVEVVQARQLPGVRRSLAPRDTWGGFR